MTTTGEDRPGPAWAVLAATRAGASHRRHGTELQDYVGVLPDPLPRADPVGVGTLRADSDEVAVLVADGHGSARSFRSAAGAKFAVAVAQSVCEELLNFEPAQQPLGPQLDPAAKPMRVLHKRSLLKAELESRVGPQMVRRWQDLVAADVAGHSFTDAEWDLLRQSQEAGGDDRFVERLAYGSTVLAAVATQHFTAFLQLGDGDVVVVDAQREASRPLAADPQLMGNATTSLCSRDAWKAFRSALGLADLAMVMVSSDGLANSYTEDRGFLGVSIDILKIAIEEGIEAVDRQLPDWLLGISDRGSGDDISIGLLFNLALLEDLRGQATATPPVPQGPGPSSGHVPEEAT